MNAEQYTATIFDLLNALFDSANAFSIGVNVKTRVPSPAVACKQYPLSRKLLYILGDLKMALIHSKRQKRQQLKPIV